MIPPTRVLHVIATLDQSGAEKQLSLLATGLPRDRYDVHVCALTRGGYYADVLRSAGIPVHLVGKRWKFDPFGLVHLYQTMKELQPTIVQTWLFTANAYGRVAARWARVPIVLVSERCVDEWKSGYHFWVDRFLSRWTDGFVVNARGIEDFYAERGFAGKRVHVIPNGVEIPSTESASGVRQELGLVEGEPVIGFVGRLWPQKRVQDLIWAADILRMSGWQSTVLIVGDGPRRASLESFADALEITEKVRFLGHREDARRIIDALDILVLPSQYEGMPNVVLEAMASGKPVVGTNIAGIRDVVKDGETGILVSPRKPLELAKGIRRLLVDPSLIASMGESGRRRAETEFSVATMIASHDALYQKLLEEKGIPSVIPSETRGD